MGNTIFWFFVKEVVLPCAKPIAEKYLIPWLTDKFGEFFCELTNWKPSTSQRQDVIYCNTDNNYMSANNAFPYGKEDPVENIVPAKEKPIRKFYRFPA